MQHEGTKSTKALGPRKGTPSKRFFDLPSRLRAFLLHFQVLVLVLAPVACGKSASPAAVSKPAASASASASPAAIAAAAQDNAAANAIALDLWTRAKGNIETGDADDLARLADHEGMNGILARAEDPAWRGTAIRAMAYVDGFDALPWLAKVAKSEPNDDAMAALDASIDMAARPRRAVDPEDAAELRQGCDALLALAKDSAAPRPRRVASIRALRMLSERGCVASNDIPTDLDAH